MGVRVTTEVFAGALLRSVRAGGGFAYVARRGDAQAGAILVAFFDRATAGYALYRAVPADPAGRDLDRDTRCFALARTLAGEAELRELVEREARFDPDFWLIEIENWAAPVADLLPVAEEG